jgi:hypothetical protein
VALAADQELALVRVLGVAAADEGVERGDAVHQAVFQQEVQRAVHGRRRRAAAVLLAEHGEDVVGAQRLVALPHQLQHAAAQGGQAQALAGAQRVGLGQCAVHAMGVIVGTVASGVMDMGSDGSGWRRYYVTCF